MRTDLSATIIYSVLLERIKVIAPPPFFYKVTNLEPVQAPFVKVQQLATNSIVQLNYSVDTIASSSTRLVPLVIMSHRRPGRYVPTFPLVLTWRCN